MVCFGEKMSQVSSSGGKTEERKSVCRHSLLYLRYGYQLYREGVWVPASWALSD